MISSCFVCVELQKISIDAGLQPCLHERLLESRRHWDSQQVQVVSGPFQVFVRPLREGDQSVGTLETKEQGCVSSVHVM